MIMSGKFKLLLVVAAVAAALGVGYYVGMTRHAGHFVEVAGTGEAGETKLQYTCGMHPFIITDEPGLCPICNMQLTPLKAGTGGGQPAERTVKHWISPMDPTYVRDAPGQDYMGHDLVPVYEGGSDGAISIDPVTSQNMGVRTALAERRDLARTIRTVGLVTYEEPRQYSVNSKVEGWVDRLYVNQVGQHVKKGQPLLTIYSPELVSAQEEFLLAVENHKRLGQSPFPEIAAGAKRLLEAARTRLRYWDISAAQIKRLEETGQVNKNLTLYSSYSGIVTMKQVVEGMRLMKGEELLQIADISRVWVIADIYEYELPWIKVGQTARVEIPFAATPSLSGKISYIYPYVQNETRTVKARIELPNPGFELKPDMYANILIDSQAVSNVLTIPIDAVLNSGRGQTVFVALGEGKFEPRQIKTGLQGEDGYVQVISGLNDADRVVTSAQFMLDSESKLREAIQKMMEPKTASEAQMSGQEANKMDELFEDNKATKKQEIEDLFK